MLIFVIAHANDFAPTGILPNQTEQIFQSFIDKFAFLMDEIVEFAEIHYYKRRMNSNCAWSLQLHLK